MLDLQSILKHSNTGTVAGQPSMAWALACRLWQQASAAEQGGGPCQAGHDGFPSSGQVARHGYSECPENELPQGLQRVAVAAIWCTGIQVCCNIGRPAKSYHLRRLQALHHSVQSLCEEVVKAIDVGPDQFLQLQQQSLLRHAGVAAAAWSSCKKQGEHCRSGSAHQHTDLCRHWGAMGHACLHGRLRQRAVPPSQPLKPVYIASPIGGCMPPQVEKTE